MISITWDIPRHLQARDKSEMASCDNTSHKQTVKNADSRESTDCRARRPRDRRGEGSKMAETKLLTPEVTTTVARSRAPNSLTVVCPAIVHKKKRRKGAELTVACHQYTAADAVRQATCTMGSGRRYVAGACSGGGHVAVALLTSFSLTCRTRENVGRDTRLLLEVRPVVSPLQ